MLCLLLLPWTAPATAAQRVVYGFHDAFPPFTYLDKGKPSGFELELLQAALQGSDYVLDPRPMPWDRILVSLGSTGVHVTSGMARTPQRERAYLFTERHSIPLVSRLFQRTDKVIRSRPQLLHAPVAARRDSLYQNDLERLGFKNVELFPDQNAPMLALRDGRVEAFCTGDKLGYYHARLDGLANISATGQPLRSTLLYYALRRDQVALRDAIDTGLERLWLSGQFDRIYRKWFVPEPDEPQIARLLAMAREGADKSYAPYSLLHRGAAVLTRSGRYYAAGDMENGLARLTTSALTIAVQMAVSQGDTDIMLALSLSPEGRAQPPSASERRLLYQFGRGVLVLMEPEAKVYETRMVAELLPYTESFSPWNRERPGAW